MNRLSYRQLIQRRARNRRERAVSKPQQSAAEPRTVVLNAAFDNAESNVRLNELFARAANEAGTLDPEARRRLIDRSRYEILQANQWFKGSVRSAVNWVIGRGCFLEVKLAKNRKSEKSRTEDARKIETEFNKWFKTIHGSRKLRVMGYAKISDGTGLAMLVSSDKVLKKTGVALTFVPFEDDQIDQPSLRVQRDWQRNYLLDGKEIDEFGEPSRYWIRRTHPAESPFDEPQPVAAEFVIDVWAWERPSQGRGNPELATAIGQGPMMRIYEQAVLDCATTAAKHTAIIETQVGAFDDGTQAYDPIDMFVEVPINVGTQTVAPAGHKVTQLKAEQPTATHAEFIRTNVSGAGRPIGQPAQIATGDAAGINFAGGQLGRQDYELDVDVQRQDWELLAMDKLLAAWLQEAALAGIIPREYGSIDDVGHDWRWTRRRHQDTMKEYSGRKVACETGLTSVAFWQEDDGVDPEEEDGSAARSLGISIEQFREARFRTLMPEAALAILGPGKSPPKTMTDPKTKPTVDPNDPNDDTNGDSNQ